MKLAPIPPCPHGIDERTMATLWDGEYQRERETGERRVQWICSCCNAPAGDETRCPSCACHNCGGQGYTLWRGFRNNCDHCEKGRIMAREGALHPEEWESSPIECPSCTNGAKQ